MDTGEATVFFSFIGLFVSGALTLAWGCSGTENANSKSFAVGMTLILAAAYILLAAMFVEG